MLTENLPSQAQPVQQNPGNLLRPRFMFIVSLCFLILLGMVLPHGGSSEVVSMTIWQETAVKGALAVLWLIIILESLPALIAFRRPDPGTVRKRALLVMLIPALRLAVQPQVSGAWMWLPFSGWQQRQPQLFHAMELRFAIPMLSVATLIIPVLIIELFFLHDHETLSWLAITLHVITTLVWAAFTFEFIVMITLAEKRLPYAKEHWINLLIIILPLIAFLRALMLIRVFRLTGLSKAFQTIRMRVLLTRAQRIMLLLNVVERVLRRFPNAYIKTLRSREQRKLRDLHDVRLRIRETELRIARRAAKDAPTKRPEGADSP